MYQSEWTVIRELGGLSFYKKFICGAAANHLASQVAISNTYWKGNL
jgi:hypothetical protein